MALTKYLITLDSEDGPFLTSPLGGVIVFEQYDDAVEAAKRGPRGSERWIHHTMPLAVYSGTREPVQTVIAEGETVEIAS